MYGNDRVINAIVYGFYWAILIYFYFRLFWKRRPVRRWAAVRGGGERGQGLVEYALILVLVAVVVIGILLVLGPAIKGIF
jgi:pilus assembly protein Flp/PilA